MKRSVIEGLRKIIESAVQSLSDETALQAVCLYPLWEAGISCNAGFKVRHNDRLFRCVQAHTSIAGWEPENTVALWEQINENNAGTPEDPIPYGGNMALTAGLYYVQAGVVYLCVRDTVTPVYHALADLVGVYVEVAG